MTVFLTSSPCSFDADHTILNPANNFLENLQEVIPDHPRALFICADPNDHADNDWFAATLADAFQSAAMPWGDHVVLDSRNAADAKTLVETAELIVLAGGHVPTQNAFFQTIGLRDLLSSYDGIVLGISAGTMNAANRVYAQPELPGESAPDFPRFLSGLGLTEVNILPHYQEIRHCELDGKRLFADITAADSMGECFFALVDGSYIMEAEGKTVLFGEAYCIEDGQIEQISEADEAIIFES